MFRSQGWVSDIDYGDETVDNYLEEARTDLELESGAWSSGLSDAEVRDRAVFLASKGSCDSYAEYAQTASELTFEGAWGLVTAPAHAEVVAQLRAKQTDPQIVAPAKSDTSQTLFHEVKVARDTVDVTALKKSVIAELSVYDSKWKLKLFGHHHGDEAKLLKNKIARAETAALIEEFLREEKLRVSRGGYFDAIVAALVIVEGFSFVRKTP